MTERLARYLLGRNFLRQEILGGEIGSEGGFAGGADWPATEEPEIFHGSRSVFLRSTKIMDTRSGVALESVVTQQLGARRRPRRHWRFGATTRGRRCQRTTRSRRSGQPELGWWPPLHGTSCHKDLFSYSRHCQPHPQEMEWGVKNDFFKN